MYKCSSFSITLSKFGIVSVLYVGIPYFLLFSSDNYFYIVDISLWLNTWFANILSVALIESVSNILNFKEVQFFIFSFLWCAFGIKSTDSLPNLGIFFPVFS